MKLTKEQKKEIYTKALQALKSDNFNYHRGICNCLGDVIKDYYSFKSILSDFRKNKPSAFEPKTWEFRFHRAYKNLIFWWTRDEEGYNQRIKFLEYLIEKNS
jgi:hypothetical protein